METFFDFKSGDRYSYIGITPKKWDELKSAASIGGFIARKIVARHKGKKLE